MERLIVALLVCPVLGACGAPPAATDLRPSEYIGTLASGLVSGGVGGSGTLEPASNEAIAALGDLVPAGAAVRRADLDTGGAGTLEVFLVEPVAGTTFVLADADGSGAIDADERVDFGPVDEYPFGTGGVLEIPLDGRRFAVYPMLIGLVNPDFFEGLESIGPASLYVGQPLLAGTVEIEGKEVSVRLGYDLDPSDDTPGWQYQLVDANRDGRFDTTWVSRETGWVEEDAVVPIYRIDDRYVSIDRYDVDTGELVLRTHPPEDYRRIELEIGATVPDFEFIDLGGATRRLAEFRGKYVLIDVWGTWCGPCRGAVPHHKRAYAAYRDRGFEILSLDQEFSGSGELDENLEKVRAFIAENEMTWTHATEESVHDLVLNRLFVTAYPTTFLLDPEGKILSVGLPGQLRLQGANLDGTLESLLGASDGKTSPAAAGH